MYSLKFPFCLCLERQSKQHIREETNLTRPKSKKKKRNLVPKKINNERAHKFITEENKRREKKAK